MSLLQVMGIYVIRFSFCLICVILTKVSVMHKYFLYYEKKKIFFLKSIEFKTHFFAMPHMLSLEMSCS